MDDSASGLANGQERILQRLASYEIYFLIVYAEDLFSWNVFFE